MKNPAEPTAVDSSEAGRSRRAETPRSALARLHDGERDPNAILEEQNASRLQDLVPLRRERMSASAFTFYRGTAAIMAADLAQEAHSGILVAACGDAHVSNFGFYASPQRTLLFDLNDFDEAAWAPWEWDLKRLVTSIVIAGRATGRDQDIIIDAATAAVGAYLQATRAIADLDPVTRYFTHFDPAVRATTLDRRSRRALDAALADAQKRTGARASRRLTEVAADGTRRFREAPPAMVRADADVEAVVARALEGYLASANIDVRMLLRHHVVLDVARRAVGVGSVGTRCHIALLGDPDGNTLILQVKEAGRSVLEQYGGIEQPDLVCHLVDGAGEGARVVGLQRILQAYSDPFLGHLVGAGGQFGYYVRQFHDMKGSIDMETLDDKPFARYAEACAIVLARAHAQSGRGREITGYAGKGPRITSHLLEWCLGYADRAEADYEVFRAGFSPTV